MKYYRALISAASKEEAEKVLELLLNKKLIAGGLITSGMSHYWWKEKINKKEYFNISVFTININRDKIIKIAEKNTKDEVPGIVFFKIDYGNKKFLNWISKNTI